MNNWAEIYWICWKQYFIKFRVWILAFSAIMLAVGVYRGTHPKEEAFSGIAVGIFVEDEMGRALSEKLEAEKGVFHFLSYGEEAQMIREIENGTLECGYVFPKGFYENLLRGRTIRQITLYHSPGSSAHKISYEVVFADLFELLSEDILKSYLKENASLNEKELYEAQKRLLELNARYAQDGSTFHFVYETGRAQKDKKPENLNTMRGIVSVIIFLMSLLGLGNCLEQKRVWKSLPGKLGRRFKSGCIHVSVLGSVLVGGVCLFLAGAGDWPFREAGGLFIYFLVLEVYIRLLGLFVKRSQAVYGLLPVMTAGCCLFSPVFVRLGRYLPALDLISAIFPATYYLNLF